MPFGYGTADCGTFAADWVREVTGRDPIARVRGSYRDADEAVRMHGRLGLARHVDQCMRGSGFARTRAPRAGDIGAIVVADVLFCAIKTHRGWLLRGDRGLIHVTGARVVGAWRVGD